MPPREINKLLWWAQIYPSFKEELLDPEQRLGALNKFQNPDKNDPMFGINPDIEAGQLTPEETKALMEIKGETIEDFTKACIEAGLIGESGTNLPPETGR